MAHLAQKMEKIQQQGPSMQTDQITLFHGCRKEIILVLILQEAIHF
jgi:hypothetical protein